MLEGLSSIHSVPVVKKEKNSVSEQQAGRDGLLLEVALARDGPLLEVARGGLLLEMGPC